MTVCIFWCTPWKVVNEERSLLWILWNERIACCLCITCRVHILWWKNDNEFLFMDKISTELFCKLSLLCLLQVAVQCHTSREEVKKYLSEVLCIVAQSCLLLATGPHPLQYTAMVAMNKIVDVTIVHRLTKDRFDFPFLWTNLSYRSTRNNTLNPNHFLFHVNYWSGTRTLLLLLA